MGAEIVAGLALIVFALSAVSLRAGFTELANLLCVVGLALGTMLLVILLMP